MIMTAGLLGGLTLALWSFFSWSVLSWPSGAERSLGNEDEVLRVLVSNLHKSGIYKFPSIPRRDLKGGAEWALYKAKRRVGPYGLIVYVPHGKDFVIPIIRGIALDLVAATLAALLTSAASHLLFRYWQRVLFVFALGIFAALVSWLTFWNWDSFPNSYFLARAADVAISWLLTGLVMGWTLWPSPSRDDRVADHVQGIHSCKFGPTF